MRFSEKVPNIWQNAFTENASNAAIFRRKICGLFNHFCFSIQLCWRATGRAGSFVAHFERCLNIIGRHSRYLPEFITKKIHILLTYSDFPRITEQFCQKRKHILRHASHNLGSFLSLLRTNNRCGAPARCAKMTSMSIPRPPMAQG